MKLILFGATGMVGASVLQQALADPSVQAVLSISRSTISIKHPKLSELLLPDLFDFSAVEAQLAGYDACIWAVGISSSGLDEKAYAKVTEELTLRWAVALLRLNPDFSFCYCSAGGAGGRMMWARVRQRVEASLKAMSFRHAGAVRPGFIQPAPGIRSKVKAYQAGIVLMTPFFPLFVPTLPGLFTTSAKLGRAMLRVVQGQSDRFILESRDINRLGQPPFS
jgi:uncharacterized protein YbjT (DUF2867 family)